MYNLLLLCWLSLYSNQRCTAVRESSDLLLCFCAGDNWTVECSGDVWRRDDSIRLRHTDTKMSVSMMIVCVCGGGVHACVCVFSGVGNNVSSPF